MLFAKTDIPISLAIGFMVIFASSNSLAADSTAIKSIKVVSLSIGRFLWEDWSGDKITGMISVNSYRKMNSTVKVFGLEASVVPLPKLEDALISGNFIFNLPIAPRVIPFAKIGLATCLHIGIFPNVGGGIRINLSDKLGIRTEYWHWWGDGNTGSIFGGISYFF